MHGSISLFVATLVGSAAAGNWGNHTISSSSSSSWSKPISSLSSTSSSSWSKPTSSSGWLKPSSSSSSIVTSSSTSSWTPVATGSWSHPPHPSKSIESLTTYTTTTVCPVTTTRAHHSSWEIVTTYTTSTLTITSCKGGCNHHPTSVPPPPPATWPTESAHGTKTHITVYPTTVTSTQTKFVPCSTPIATSSGTTYFSTWLTPSYVPTTYISTCTETWTSSKPTKTPVAPLPPAGSCPAVATVTQTVTVTAGPSKPTPPPVCKNCYETHTITLTNGQTTCITITHSETSKPTKPVKPVSSTSSKPTGTGNSSLPVGTGNIKWHKPTVASKAW